MKLLFQIDHFYLNKFAALLNASRFWIALKIRIPQTHSKTYQRQAKKNKIEWMQPLIIVFFFSLRKKNRILLRGDRKVSALLNAFHDAFVRFTSTVGLDLSSILSLFDWSPSSQDIFTKNGKKKRRIAMSINVDV